MLIFHVALDSSRQSGDQCPLKNHLVNFDITRFSPSAQLYPSLFQFKLGKRETRVIKVLKPQCVCDATHHVMMQLSNTTYKRR